MNWSYGITTVPERWNTTFALTKQSLTKAGSSKPRVFIDGIPFKMGHLANWMRTAFVIYTTNPDADRYAVFEDDFISGWRRCATM